MTVCPNQDVDGLPLRRRLRRVHGRARARCSPSTGSTASPTASASPRRRWPSRSPASSTARSWPGSATATTWSSSAPARSAACTCGWPGPAAPPGCSWSTSTRSGSPWPPTWCSPTPRSAAPRSTSSTRSCKLTDGRGADVVITAAASGAAQEQALQMAARQGRISFFGGLPKDNPIDHARLQPRALPRADDRRRQRLQPGAQQAGARAHRHAARCRSPT